MATPESDMTYTEMLDILCSGDWLAKKHLLVAAKSIPDNILIELARDEYWETRHDLVFRDNLPEKVKIMLASDSDSSVREAAIKRFSRQLSDDFLKGVAQTDDSWYCADLARKELIMRGKYKTGRFESCAKLLNQLTEAISKEFYLRMLDIVHSDMVAKRYQLAHLVWLPPDIQMALASDENSSVRAALASNHRLATATIRKLSKDPEGRVRITIAGTDLRPLPPDVIRTLAADDWADVRSRLAQNGSQHFPLSVENALKNDPDDSVRRGFGARYSIKDMLDNIDTL